MRRNELHEMAGGNATGFMVDGGNTFTRVDTNGIHIRTVDMHTGGEPVRIVVEGCPPVSGEKILEKRKYMKEHLDEVRQLLMLEPRGHHNMYGAFLVPPDDPRADLGVLFMHNEGYSAMCGHATIALGRFAVDYGYAKEITEPETEVNIQCPCGVVKLFVEGSGGKSRSVRFESVVAFVVQIDLEVNVPGYGRVTVDVSYGGTFYAFISDSALGISISDSPIDVITNAAWAVTEAVKKVVKLDHPDSDDLAFLYGTIITDGKDAWSEEPTSNICVFAQKEVDRSPTGSGVTARIALQYHKGQIKIGQKRTFQNAKTKSQFTGKALREVSHGKYKGVVVEVSGRAYYTGESYYVRETGDELGKGFLIS